MGETLEWILHRKRHRTRRCTREKVLSAFTPQCSAGQGPSTSCQGQRGKDWHPGDDKTIGQLEAYTGRGLRNRAANRGNCYKVKQTQFDPGNSTPSYLSKKN